LLFFIFLEIRDLGVLVGILEFIPFLGSIISIALIALIAIASLEDVWQIISVISLIIIIMNLEGNLLTPYSIGKKIFFKQGSYYFRNFILWVGFGALS
jgi:hypothetical protein